MLTLLGGVLQGAGQIVGMGDTGIDLDSCFFRDSNLPSVSAGNWPLDSTGEGRHTF